MKKATILLLPHLAKNYQIRGTYKYKLNKSLLFPQVYSILLSGPVSRSFRSICFSQNNTTKIVSNTKIISNNYFSTNSISNTNHNNNKKNYKKTTHRAFGLLAFACVDVKSETIQNQSSFEVTHSHPTSFTSSSKLSYKKLLTPSFSSKLKYKRCFHTCSFNKYVYNSNSNSNPKIKSSEEDLLSNTNIEKLANDLKLHPSFHKKTISKSQNDFPPDRRRELYKLLANEKNFYKRIKIRIKWLLMRQVRPFNADDLSAIASWFLVGNVLWILLGTTTFASLLILMLNTVFAQEQIAEYVGNYLTKETGMVVVFESAIVPKWRDGSIQFKNVFLSRRPGAVQRRVSKGSRSVAVANAAAAIKNNNFANVLSSNLEAGNQSSILKTIPNTSAHLEEENDDSNNLDKKQNIEMDDGNYTQFDLSVDSINVTLSFQKWMNGRGILENVEIKGLRGVVDRTHVKWNPEVDPRTYRHSHNTGDFEIDNFVLEDSLVTLYQPNGFRPFNVSIFTCELPRLRKQWLFYDLLSANHISGSYDNSLFTIHSRQSLLTGETNSGSSDSAWKKVNRCRIDGVSIDHLNSGITSGPFSWIADGNVDISADLYLPSEMENTNLSNLVLDIIERWEKNIQNRVSHLGSNAEKIKGRDINKTILSNSSTNDSNDVSFTKINLSDLPLSAHNDSNSHLSSFFNNYIIQPDEGDLDQYMLRNSSNKSNNNNSANNKYIIMDLRVQLNNVRAVVPIFTNDLSYINNAMIRPIVAYINAHDSYIPINCRVVKFLKEFDGSWSIFDCGLMDDISAEVYDAFARSATDAEARSRRIKKVGLWSLQLAAQIFLLSLGTIA